MASIFLSCRKRFKTVRIGSLMIPCPLVKVIRFRIGSRDMLICSRLVLLAFGLVIEQREDYLPAIALHAAAQARDGLDLAGSLHSVDGLGAGPEKVGHFLGRHDRRQV